MIQVKYLWASHTFIKLNWTKIKVLNWEIIEVPKDKKKFFITNWFEEIWNSNPEEIQESIEKLERESINDENSLEINIKILEDNLFKDIKDLESKFNEREKERKLKMSILKEKLINLK